MQMAISLAESTHVRTIPNPKVACILVDSEGVIATGVHGESGVEHADVIALRKAAERARNATAYVTLEPCGHVGKTPPCAHALIEAGISRVVYAVKDPIHGGEKELRNAGIDVITSELQPEALFELAPWLHAATCEAPFVTLKIAATLDGFIAAPDGSSKWITSDASRHYVQQIRMGVDGIITSTQTVQMDSPAFTIRDYEVQNQPHVYILGESTIPNFGSLESRYTQIASHDPAAVLQQAQRDGRTHLLIEAGGKVAATFLQANLVNRLIWISAPVLMGDGRKAIAGLGVSSIQEALRPIVERQFMREQDFVTVMRLPRCSH